VLLHWDDGSKQKGIAIILVQQFFVKIFDKTTAQAERKD
jgi:hypothetical protein